MRMGNRKLELEFLMVDIRWSEGAGWLLTGRGMLGIRAAVEHG